MTLRLSTAALNLALLFAPRLAVAAEKATDPYAKEGNITPRIEKPTPEQESKILGDLKLADGFEATLFAAPPAVNYPVFVASAPDGTLYVSSDGNGSLGRNPHRRPAGASCCGRRHRRVPCCPRRCHGAG